MLGSRTESGWLTWSRPAWSPPVCVRVRVYAYTRARGSSRNVGACIRRHRHRRRRSVIANDSLNMQRHSPDTRSVSEQLSGRWAKCEAGRARADDAEGKDEKRERARAIETMSHNRLHAYTHGRARENASIFLHRRRPFSAIQGNGTFIDATFEPSLDSAR